MPNMQVTAAKGPLSKALGWFALGLGAAELFAPKRLAKFLGISTGPWTSSLIRTCGVREAATGLGILSSSNPSFWLGARVAGDAMDAGLLGRTAGKKRWFGLFREGERNWKLSGALLAVGGVAVLDAIAFGRSRKQVKEQAKPWRAAKVTAAITIDRSASDLYAFWRDVENLPRFATYLESVTTTDKIRSHWRAKMPHGPALAWDATIVEDRPDQRITWKMEPGKLASVFESGEVRFDPAPGGRGTEVHLTLWGGRMGSKVLGRWLRKLPERFWAAQLLRFKELMELGEITVSDASAFTKPHPARPVKEELTSAPLASSAAPVPGPTVAEEGRPS